MREKIILLFFILLVNLGCQTAPKVLNLAPILQTPQIIWLGENLSDEEWQTFTTWFDTSLIPYVTELENR